MTLRMMAMANSMAEMELQCGQMTAWQKLTIAMQWRHGAEGYLKGQDQVYLSKRLEGTGKLHQTLCRCHQIVA